MDDPHSPPSEAECAAAADEARRTVAAVYDLHRVGTKALHPEVIKTRLRDVWRVSLPEGSPVSHLLVAIPWVFPDELPDVYVQEELLFQGARIPHLNHSRQLCTLDDTTRFPNLERSGDAVLEVIDRAVQIIGDGLAGQNQAEYWDEFESYWIDSAKSSVTAISVVRPDGPHREVVMAQLSPKIGDASWVFTDDEVAAADFLDAFDQRTEKSSTTPALYLHLENIGNPLHLRTNADVKRVLPSSEYEVLSRFLKKATRPSTVLFSIPVGGQRVFGGWVHEQFSMNIYKGKKSVKLKGQAAGWREGHLPVEIELTGKYRGQPLGRVLVRRVDPGRLAQRSIGDEAAEGGAVNIIGCGSVGGFLARAFSYGAPAPLRLIDPEDLEIHNVPRHVCDLTYAGLKKVNALRSLLRKSNPHLQVEVLPEDVREILRTAPDRMVPARLTIVAVANVAAERRVNTVARDLDLGLVAYVWIEPHAIAGHALLVPRQGKGCFECLVDSSTGAVAPGVLKDPDSFAKADAGCRGSFVPYGGRDLEEFVTVIAREIASAKIGDTGVVITWLGNLDFAKQKGWVLHDSWKNATSYSVQHRVISPQADCRVCAA